MSSTGWKALAIAVAAIAVATVVGIVLGNGSSERIEGWVSVKDYGAKGDGSSGDRAAVQKALDKEPAGTTLVFPPGTYNIDAALKSNKTMMLYGHGATLTATARMPYMLRYNPGARKGVGHGVRGLTLDMNNAVVRDGVERGLEIRDSWHSVVEVQVVNARSGTAVYVGPLTPEPDTVGTYYNELRVMASGDSPAKFGDPGSIGVELAGLTAGNASNANVIVGRAEGFDRGLKVGPFTDANVLREFDATGNAIGMDLAYGRTLGYGLWAEVNRDRDVMVRSGAKARLDFQYFQKRPEVESGGELRLYP